jgi:hypothetical protein
MSMYNASRNTIIGALLLGASVASANPFDRERTDPEIQGLFDRIEALEQTGAPGGPGGAPGLPGEPGMGGLPGEPGMGGEPGAEGEVGLGPTITPLGSVNGHYYLRYERPGQPAKTIEVDEALYTEYDPDIEAMLMQRMGQ